MRSALVLASSLALALAAAAPRAGAAGPARDAELESVLADIAAARGVSARFSERKELALLAEPLVSRGRIYFAPPDRFARFTTEPDFTALLIDGGRVRYRDGSGDDALDLSGSPITRAFVENFVALWSGDRARLERLYAIALHREGEGWELALSPRGAPIDRVIEVITLRGREKVLEEMRVRERDGDVIATRFDAIEIDRAFSDEELERLFGRGLPLEGAAAGR